MPSAYSLSFQYSLLPLYDIIHQSFEGFYKRRKGLEIISPYLVVASLAVKRFREWLVSESSASLMP